MFKNISSHQLEFIKVALVSFLKSLFASYLASSMEHLNFIC